MPPTREYRIFNTKETTPTDNPPSGFMYLFPRDGKWWQKNPDGVETMLGFVDASNISGIPAWDENTEYSLDASDLYVMHAQRIWELVSDTSQGQEPGVSADWDEVPFSRLQHLQNTDFKHGRHEIKINVAGAFLEVNMMAAAYKEKNVIIIGDEQSQGWATAKSVSFKTYDSSTKDRADHIFFVQVLAAPGQTAPVDIDSDGNQYVTGEYDLQLNNGDWLVCRGASWGGSANPRTLIIASSKMTGAGGGNPFNQDLNTSNNVEFNALKLPPLAAGAGEKKNVVVDDAGNQESTPMANLTTTPLSQITMYDEVLEANVTYKSINGVWTAI